jgi:hypothetical protein
MYRHIFINMYIHIYILRSVYVNTYIYMYIYICIYIYMCIYALYNKTQRCRQLGYDHSKSRIYFWNTVIIKITVFQMFSWFWVIISWFKPYFSWVHLSIYKSKYGIVLSSESHSEMNSILYIIVWK